MEFLVERYSARSLGSLIEIDLPIDEVDIVNNDTVDKDYLLDEIGIEFVIEHFGKEAFLKAFNIESTSNDETTANLAA